MTKRAGALDVLAQHVMGMLVAEPRSEAELLAEIRDAAPYADLSDEDFARILAFVIDGGYALRAYERFARVKRDKEGRLRVANARIAQSYRMNVGTIVESTMLKVHLGKPAGSGKACASGVCWGRWRSISRKALRPAIPSFSQAKC